MTPSAPRTRLACVAGLAPVPRDSGRINGNLHRPRRYSRRLLRVFYLSALFSIHSCPASKTYYDRKQRRGQTPRPSRPGAGPTTPERPVGDAPRRNPLPGHAGHQRRLLSAAPGPFTGRAEESAEPDWALDAVTARPRPGLVPSLRSRGVVGYFSPGWFSRHSASRSLRVIMRPPKLDSTAAAGSGSSGGKEGIGSRIVDNVGKSIMTIQRLRSTDESYAVLAFPNASSNARCAALMISLTSMLHRRPPPEHR
jgi:hypothetical protein